MIKADTGFNFVFVLVLTSIATQAGAVTISTSNPVFTNAVTSDGTTLPDPELNTSPVAGFPNGDAFLNWGDPFQAANTNANRSGYVFDAASSVMVPTIGTPFQIGTFTHRNNPITAPSLLSVVFVADFTVDLDMDGGVDVSTSLVWDIDHNETPNFTSPCPGGDTEPCGDIVSFTTAIDNGSFEIDGVLYELSIFGFSQDGINFTTSFFSDEDASNNTQVWAQVSTVVPIPAAVWLFGSALVGMFGFSRKLAS